ncbi:hypothetical protein [Psychroserpens burtonensis]|uniref:hypothetical protein n=1 Tax=Psychroserpens burtonensis TaxID=49278 RepID=UPI00041781A0|nr:hypothetical protein [Psychroserpens burtonensis]
MKTQALSVIFFFGMLIASSQTANYNTQKDYVAKGYDVIAYFDNQAVEGKNEYIARYDGVKFKFLSEKNLNTF